MRHLPVAITFLVGSALAVAPFLPGEVGNLIEERAAVWFDILAALAFVAGASSLLKAHVDRIEARAPQWGYSAVTVSAFWFTLAAGLFKLGAPSWETAVCERGTWLRLIYDAVYVPVQASIIGLLAFYVASGLTRAAALARGGRALMLSVAAIVLVDRALGSGALTRWILAGAGLGGLRALTISIAVGVVFFSLRVIAGIDRPLGGADRDAAR